MTYSKPVKTYIADLGDMSLTKVRNSVRLLEDRNWLPNLLEEHYDFVRKLLLDHFKLEVTDNKLILCNEPVEYKIKDVTLARHFKVEKATITYNIRLELDYIALQHKKDIVFKIVEYVDLGKGVSVWFDGDYEHEAQKMIKEYIAGDSLLQEKIDDAYRRVLAASEECEINIMEPLLMEARIREMEKKQQCRVTQYNLDPHVEQQKIHQRRMDERKIREQQLSRMIVYDYNR